MRRIAVIALMACLAAFGVGCGDDNDQSTASTSASTASSAPAKSEPSGEPVHVALVTPLSGELASVGEQEKQAVELAVKLWNAKGGVQGRPVELTTEDFGSDNAGAVTAVKKISGQSDVVGLICCTSSSATLAADRAIAEAKIPTVTGMAAATDVTLTGNDYMHRVIETSGTRAPFFAKFLADKTGAKSVYILAVNDDFGKGEAEQMAAEFEKAGASSKTSFFPYDEDNFAPYAGDIRSAKPDLVYVASGSAPVSLAVVEGLRENGVETEISLSTAGAGRDFVGQAQDPSLLEGVYTNARWAPSDTGEASEEFVAEFENEYGDEPDFFHAGAYAAANVLLEAINDAKDISRAGVQQALETVSYDGPYGMIVFDSKTHQALVPITAYQITDGKLSAVEKQDSDQVKQLWAATAKAAAAGS
jgi:branched-chain amino acid transport system substrate-binding protein